MTEPVKYTGTGPCQNLNDIVMISAVRLPIGRFGGSLKDFPVYESDYSLKGSQDGLEKNKVFEWTRQAIMELERYANILGSEPLKHALISALQPIDCRPNMDELCRFLLTPLARESLESL